MILACSHESQVNMLVANIIHVNNSLHYQLTLNIWVVWDFKIVEFQIKQVISLVSIVTISCVLDELPQ